jgi:FkbM family methyltransferase
MKINDFIRLRINRPWKLLIRGIDRGVFIDFLKYYFFGGYVIERVNRNTMTIRVRDTGILYEIPTRPVALNREYCYSIDPLTELSIRPFFAIDGIFIDIGAFVGKYALAHAARTPSNRVLAIEPNPTTQAILVHNINRNGLANQVIVQQVAVGARGYVSFTLEGALSRIADRPLVATTVKVRSMPLLDIMRKSAIRPEDVRLIKIDVEGSEAPILKEICRHRMQFKRLRIIVEIIDEQKIVVALMIRSGFSVRKIDENNFLFELNALSLKT